MTQKSGRLTQKSELHVLKELPVMCCNSSDVRVLVGGWVGGWVDGWVGGCGGGYLCVSDLEHLSQKVPAALMTRFTARCREAMAAAGVTLCCSVL